ncbi:site-specific DNA-methyltransferase [Stutzerimonas stutzeri]|uniref:site-specific DNA-methyltransferase n=1 Tax=Stutzerimonas stutzeri TaxID=316 RepID=UPI00244A1930|nr:site-specific DNA-methyltransferase [Stutzerimonas stutzeri]MDH1557219.1 site-specific DNA-methyltransferase [Stutzerimonas stutzeri]
MEKLKMHSPDLSQENIAKIRELFPGCVTEARDDKTGKLRLAVDFDQLKQELSDHIVEGPQERYRLDWPGKREALAMANAPIAKVLRPCREESVSFEDTQNLFVEGDNLDALKILQESYLGKIKFIYIDPPYNTGNDFIYKDDFSVGHIDYLHQSGQLSEQGALLVANTSSNGRFHSDWLSMMYARIKLARNLLHENGLMFLSIDDNEVSNLIKICDEVFGDGNFVGSMSWLKKRKGSFLSKRLVSMTEWLLVYGKSPNNRLFGGTADDSESQPLIKRTNSVGILTFPPKKVETKLADGVYNAGVYGDGSSSVELLGSIRVANGIIEDSFSLKGPFIWGQNYLDAQIEGGARLVVNTASFQVRAFKAPDPDAHKGLSTFINGLELGATNEDGYEQLRDLLQSEGVMSYPKPVNYVKYLMGATTRWDKNSIVLDFFAGSSTTAHAAMELNAEDGGRRRFIMVQLAEACSPETGAFKAGYASIAEVSKERIRRAGSRIRKGKCHPNWNLDVGFRVLKIDTSNMKDVYYRPDQLSQADLFESVDNVKPDRSAEDLLFQVLVDWGVDLSLPIRRETLHGKTVFFVDDNALVACFDQGISEELVKGLAKAEPLRVVFRDNGFASDALKINVEQIFRQLSPSTEVRTL